MEDEEQLPSRAQLLALLQEKDERIEVLERQIEHLLEQRNPLPARDGVSGATPHWSGAFYEEAVAFFEKNKLGSVDKALEDFAGREGWVDQEEATVLSEEDKQLLNEKLHNAHSSTSCATLIQEFIKEAESEARVTSAEVGLTKALEVEPNVPDQHNPSIAERMEKALRADDVDTVKKWYHNNYDEGRDPTVHLFTPVESDALEKGLLHLAAECNAIRTLRYLLSEYRSGTQKHEVKMDPHQPDASDSACTPLHHAASGGHREVARCLVLQHKCDPNVEDGYGSPPLHYAAYNDYSDFVRMMVRELHADVNVGGTAGYQPPIFSAAQGNAVATIRVMVEELGCNPESTMEMYDDEIGAPLESVQTLMECAVEYEAHDVVKYLRDRAEQKKQQEGKMLPPTTATGGNDAKAGEEEEEDEWVHDEESGYMYGSKCGLYYDEESGCYYDPGADVWMDEDGETVPG